MPRATKDELSAFLMVAKEKSFTRASEKLGLSSSALSHSMRSLEERLGVRLLNRTTRSVAPTEVGEHLIETIAPHIEAIDIQLAAISNMSSQPSGTIRITAGEHPAETVLSPAIAAILPKYPDIKVEIMSDSSLLNIVSERFDAGVRMGDMVERDMVAVRIGPDIRVAIVGSPAYFHKTGIPKKPKDLLKHNCITMRSQTSGVLYSWELLSEEGGRMLHLKVDGQMVVNSARLAHKAALNGVGIACLPEHYVMNSVQSGKLIQIMDEQCPTYPGYYLYYPSPTRRQPTPAFSLLLKELQKRANDYK